MKSSILRLFRNGFALTLAGAAWYGLNDPRYLVLAPVINAACKWLREKYGIKYLPL